MLIQWDESLNVGIEKINEQHKILIKLINDLHSAMLTGKSKEIMSEILKELKNYTVIHFSTEEKLFDNYQYSETEMHKMEHDIFVEKVSKFFDDFNNGSVIVSIDLMNFLKDWLINHIKGTDMKYKEFFEEKGLK